jgi:hypothetical protein
MNKNNWRHLVILQRIEHSDHSDKALKTLKLLLDYVSDETLVGFFEDYIREDDDSEGEDEP